MEFLKKDQVFFEQVAYPERRCEEDFLRELHGLETIYMYQVDLTRDGVNPMSQNTRKPFL